MHFGSKISKKQYNQPKERQTISCFETVFTSDRVTDVGDEVTKLRNPRLLQADGIMRPYNKDEAAGLALLHQVEKGKYAATEDYVCHMVLTTDKKHVLVLTSK